MSVKTQIIDFVTRAKPGQTRQFPIRVIETAGLSRNVDPDSAFRSLVSNTNRARSGRGPAKFAVRRYDSLGFYEVTCLHPFKPGSIPASENVGRPRKWNFDTARVGHEFTYPCDPSMFARLKSRIRSAAGRQGAKLSIRSVRSGEPHLRVRVVGRSTRRSKYPFGDAMAGDRFFFADIEGDPATLRRKLHNAARGFGRRIKTRKGRKDGVEGVHVVVTGADATVFEHNQIADLTNTFRTSRDLKEGDVLFFPTRIEDVHRQHTSLRYLAKKEGIEICSRYEQTPDKDPNKEGRIVVHVLSVDREKRQPPEIDDLLE